MQLEYKGQNLQGRSFKGQNLTSANFQGADIRGADFTDANLRDATFFLAKCGLPIHLQLILLIILFFIGALSLFTAGVVAVFAGVQISPAGQIIGQYLILFINPILLTIFLSVAIYLGLNKAVITIVFLAVFSCISLIFFQYYEAAAAFAGNLLWLFTVGVTGAIIFTSVIILTKYSSGIFIGAGFIAWVISTFIPLILGQPHLILVKVAFSSAIGVSISIYASQQAILGMPQLAWIRSIAIAFAAIGGTNFSGADLTDADFTSATLKNTDFRKANLTRTRFYESKELDLAIGDAILAKRDILNLLVSCHGRNKSYVGANLQGANLIGANLEAANLKGADLSGAVFQGACLEWTNLTLAQAVGTDFTSAQMTGACIEAWNIESTTKLDHIDCRFIYLLENPKPGTDDRERRPSSGNFQPGEFTKLFEEVLNTVDLIFRNGIDWKAFIATLRKVQEENGGSDLAIQSIANKGDGVVVVKVNVPDGTDKEKIHNDFMQNYQLALQAVEERYKAQLQAKDNEIVIYRHQSADMREIISLLANKPINVQVDNKVETKAMTNSNDSSRNINIGNIGGDFNASGQALNVGEISGKVTNTINQLPPAPAPQHPGIKELLMQLQAAIESEKDLTQEDKAEALEQVKALAEAGKNPQEEPKQKAARTALKILKGTTTSLPATATIVEAVSKLLPLISKLLGLG